MTTKTCFLFGVLKAIIVPCSFRVRPRIMIRMSIQGIGEGPTNSKHTRKRRSSQITTPTDWYQQGSGFGNARIVIPCSTSSELSRSSSPDIVGQEPNQILSSQRNGCKIQVPGKNEKTPLKYKSSAKRGPDSTSSNEIEVKRIVTQRTNGEAAQPHTPPRSSQTRPKVIVVIPKKPIKQLHASEPRSYRRIIVSPLNPPKCSGRVDSSGSEETLPSQSYITLRDPEEINQLAQEYHNLPPFEQRKYLKTQQVRTAIWPKQHRPPEALLELALTSMRPHERHCKYPFAFNSHGNPYAEYGHLRANEEHLSNDSTVIPSIEIKRSKRSRPFPNADTEQKCERLPARYSPDLWTQDQSSFIQELTLRTENEKYRKENERLRAEIRKLKQRGIAMTRHLEALERLRNRQSEESTSPADQSANDKSVTDSGMRLERGTTFVVKIHNGPSNPNAQAIETAQT